MDRKVGLAALILMFAGDAHAGDKEKEPSAILEIGGASEWNLQNGAASVGPSVAVEFDAIKDWLELEVGFSPLLKKGSSPEWSTDLLFKKPFTLSNTVEFMIGDGLSLDDMVTAHMAKLPNISKGAATAAVINTPKGAVVYARERNARLTKALRG
jgi:hypothetical protein